MSKEAEPIRSKLRVGVIGGTGYVGQRFVSILDQHPWFAVTAIAASPRSAGKTYSEAVSGRWKIDTAMPAASSGLVVDSISNLESFCENVDFVFCAVDMKKDEIRQFEEKIARLETPVVSNNSAHRWTSDVPMIIPEINPEHASLIESFRKKRGLRRGFIAVKPNCSIQSYVPALEPLRDFGLDKISVCTYQAISGAGKTFAEWPEMASNLIPYIGGEEEKSETEPLKIWGIPATDHIELAVAPLISAQCYRVAVQEGHTAAVSVKFKQKPAADEILARWDSFAGLPQLVGLPTAPIPFLRYLPDNDRPQPLLDCMAGGGMAVSIGRLRDDPLFDYKFVCLSHNTLRGAAGGAVLTAELLLHLGYLTAK